MLTKIFLFVWGLLGINTKGADPDKIVSSGMRLGMLVCATITLIVISIIYARRAYCWIRPKVLNFIFTLRIQKKAYTFRKVRRDENPQGFFDALIGSEIFPDIFHKEEWPEAQICNDGPVSMQQVKHLRNGFYKRNQYHSLREGNFLAVMFELRDFEVFLASINLADMSEAEQKELHARLINIKEKLGRSVWDKNSYINLSNEVWKLQLANAKRNKEGEAKILSGMAERIFAKPLYVKLKDAVLNFFQLEKEPYTRLRRFRSPKVVPIEQPAEKQVTSDSVS